MSPSEHAVATSAQPRENIRAQPQPDCPLCNTRGVDLYEGLCDLVYGAPGTWNLKQCPDDACGLVWMDPMPIAKDLANAYPQTYCTHQGEPAKSQLGRLFAAMRDGYLQRRLGYTHGAGPRWCRRLALMAWLYPAAESEFGFSAMYLPAPRIRARVLDVGCGNGESLSLMRRLGWEVEGVDVDPMAVAIARAKGISVHLGDVASVAYPDDSFDAIFMSHVLEHVHDPINLLRECRRILKVGGRLVALTPNVDSWGHRRFGRAWQHLDPPRHLMLFRRQSLAQVVRTADLRIERLTTTVRGATTMWLRSRQIRRGGPISSPEIAGARPWLRALPFQTAEEWGLRFKPDIGEELQVVATKSGPSGPHPDPPPQATDSSVTTHENLGSQL
jgi:SAM-dependent methyltransferase